MLYTSITDAQIITTIAGNGTSLSSGDGGPAISAGLSVPYGGELDKVGNYYFVETANNKVRMLSINGNIYTIAGTGIAGYSGDGGPSTSAQVSGPQWVATDKRGNIYISDAGNKRIRKISGDGIISTIAGNGLGGYNGDGIPATDASIQPSGVCVDSDGNLFIADVSRIRMVNSLNVISTVIGTGVVGFSGDGGLANLAQIHAHGVYVHGGDLYICDFNRIRRVKKESNVIETIAGTGLGSYNGDNINALTANFAAVALAWDWSDNILIADMGNNRIRMVDNIGIIHTVAGNGIPGFLGDGGLAIDAQLYDPSGIAFDTCWNLLATCKQNFRIRKIAFNPECLPISVPQITADAPLSIHPNPATNHLSITYVAGIQSVTITDMLGCTVLHQSLTGQHTAELPMQLSPGCYTITINHTPPQKLIIQ